MHKLQGSKDKIREREQSMIKNGEQMEVAHRRAEELEKQEEMLKAEGVKAGINFDDAQDIEQEIKRDEFRLQKEELEGRLRMIKEAVSL